MQMCKPKTTMATQVLRKIAAENASALVPHYTALIPSIVSLLQQTQGPTKLAGDRTLGRVLQVTAYCHILVKQIFGSSACSCRLAHDVYIYIH